jgi:hypothetical protein
LDAQLFAFGSRLMRDVAHRAIELHGNIGLIFVVNEFDQVDDAARPATDDLRTACGAAQSANHDEGGWQQRRSRGPNSHGRTAHGHYPVGAI